MLPLHGYQIIVLDSFPNREQNKNKFCLSGAFHIANDGRTAMPAAEQLHLDVGAERLSVPQEIDLTDAMIAAHGGDARRAVRELMLDADFLRDQLYTASRLMSQGYGRSWRPKYERL